MNLKSIANKAKQAIDKRGGTDGLKENLGELQNIAKGQGSAKDKAKRAADALKNPGAAEKPSSPSSSPPASDATPPAS